MFIRELQITNFKGFKDDHTLKFDKNLAFFVGENNSGKSTIFEAVSFLKSGLPKGKKIDDLKTKKTSGHLSVEVKIQEDITSIITDFSEKKYLPYVYDEDGIETLRAKRTSEDLVIQQGKKEVIVTTKKILLWHPENKQFENPSGIDSAFGSLLETQFIWADTNPEDVTDFGSTKICGRLLDGAIGDFFESKLWENFITQHEETFHGSKGSLASRTDQLAKEIQDILEDQYGKADVKFNFDLPDVSSFIKSGGINLDDGTDTSSKEKGTGMQRALALALIQVYADTLARHPEDTSKTKPIFFFIDEPETFLHPKAQKTLLDALDKISDVRQVCVATHSPYLLKSFNASRHHLHLFKKDKDSNRVQTHHALDLFGASSPTWGEINYSAYGVFSVEFHNELYGFVQAKAIDINDDNERTKEFDEFLNSQGIPSDLDWIRQRAGGNTTYKVTVQTYIRNSIHHPENTLNNPYNQTQLHDSTNQLIALLKSLP